MKRKPSPATIIASVALFFSFGGASLAASHYLITSTHQIKPSVLQKLRGPRGAQGVQGTPGAPGPQGVGGPEGPPATTTYTSTISNPGKTVAPDATSSITLTCDPGTQVVSGGYASTRGLEVTTSMPVSNGWQVVVFNNNAVPGSYQAVAVCASSR